MNILPHRSLKSKLIVVVTTLIFFIVAFQVIYFPSRQLAESRLDLEHKAVAVTQLVAHNASAGLEFGQPALVDEVFRGVSGDDELFFMVLYDAKGTVFASHAPAQAPDVGGLAAPPSTVTSMQPWGLRVDVPVKGETETGHLVAGFTTDRIDRVATANQVTTLVTGGVILLVGIVVALWLATTVGNRVRDIADVAEQIAAGRLTVEDIGAGSQDEIGRLASSLTTMIGTLRSLHGYVDRVGQGDLSQNVSADGELADAFRNMVGQQRDLVAQIASTSAAIGASSGQILASTQLQEQGASDQAAVVEETLRTMDSLLRAANKIADASQEVLDNAERSHKNTELISDRIKQLADHTNRIGEVLEVIRDIANKADLLALNAALEGTRAGEAGRGFSQVATRMQRLTESVMGAVRDIKSLTVDIREATSASVLATEEATKRSASSADSARQIRLTIQQQQSGTEQVSSSMEEISSVIRNSVAASGQTREASAELAELARQLQTQVRRFQLPVDG